MGPVQAITSGFRNYAFFSGRASLTEFLWFFAFMAAGCSVASLIDDLFFTTPFDPEAGVFATRDPQYAQKTFLLPTIVPFLSLLTRRTRDGGADPIWMGLVLAILIVGCGMIFLAALPSGGSPPYVFIFTGFAFVLIGLAGAGFLSLRPTHIRS